MTDKTVITAEMKIKEYFEPLAARGSGRVRSLSVGDVNAAWDNDSLTIDVKEANFGLYQIQLTDVRIITLASAMDTPENLDEAGLSTYRKDEVVRILRNATVGFSDHFKHITASSRNLFGESYVVLAFNEVSIAVESKTDSNSGACLVCQGTEFSLSTFATVRIKSIGENVFESTAPASLSLRPMSASIRCVKCNTPHRGQERSVGFTLDGRSSKGSSNLL